MPDRLKPGRAERPDSGLSQARVLETAAGKHDAPLADALRDRDDGGGQPAMKRP